MHITAGLGRIKHRRCLRVTIGEEHRLIADQLWGERPLLGYVVQPESDQDRRSGIRRLVISPSDTGHMLSRNRTPTGHRYLSVYWGLGKGLPWLPAIRGRGKVKVLNWDRRGLELSFKVAHKRLVQQSPKRQEPQIRPKLQLQAANAVADLTAAKDALNAALDNSERSGVAVSVEQPVDGGPINLSIKL